MALYNPSDYWFHACHKGRFDHRPCFRGRWCYCRRNDPCVAHSLRISDYVSFFEMRTLALWQQEIASWQYVILYFICKDKSKHQRTVQYIRAICLASTVAKWYTPTLIAFLAGIPKPPSWQLVCMAGIKQVGSWSAYARVGWAVLHWALGCVVSLWQYQAQTRGQYVGVASGSFIYHCCIS